MKKNLIVFDLDGTALCSRHRQLTRPDGSLCLTHWRENSTREKVMQDKPLPLAHLWRALWAKQQAYIAICTARVLTMHDIDLLEMHGLRAHYTLSRDGDGDTRKDADLKREKLTPLIQLLKPRRIFLFDDNHSVLAMAASLGITTIDATVYNQLKAIA